MSERSSRSRTNEDPVTYHLYILAGQSNMDGMGFVSDLPSELNAPQEGTIIYNPTRRDDQQPVQDLGKWETLQPGHGYGHRFTQGDKVEQVLSDRFGPELSFARRLKELQPDQNIALFKYAKGGSSIHPDTPDDWGCWDPDFDINNGINQWTHFEYHYLRATNKKDSFGQGTEMELKPSGIVWMQGESDAAYSEEIARAYSVNLAKVIRRIRSLTGIQNLPVVIGQISGTGMEGSKPALPWAEIVQEAQQTFVEQDTNAALVQPPEGHGWLDAWHYDSETYLQLGKRFAEAMDRLRE
ncbi:sialate O-acetylesterase [Aliifodinibius sp. S!AR15-10]|uniref:sialate O-acetylesterase n=1 Tax=Aliifodinibius sp. S!AR15-10 TaxID=2950437 RepID=UPI0028569082|nr:sialate O-acetylesterase [Aliifodinibius sp. S!AR15-10]MDR8391704.1 sialate O-acetylesterase [Aliifodinibius sp. S!AR15-10]